MKVNALDRAVVEAFSNKFPSRTTMHQCARMSEDFTMSLFSSFLKDYLEVRQGGERVVGVMVAFTDPFSR